MFLKASNKHPNWMLLLYKRERGNACFTSVCLLRVSFETFRFCSLECYMAVTQHIRTYTKAHANYRTRRSPRVLLLPKMPCAFCIFLWQTIWNRLEKDNRWRLIESNSKIRQKKSDTPDESSKVNQEFFTMMLSALDSFLFWHHPCSSLSEALAGGSRSF